MWHIFQISILLIICLSVGYTMSKQGSSSTQFTVYWNVPTFICKYHGVNFEETLKKFNIRYNIRDEFRGKTIAIFYNPGWFPTAEKTKSGTYIEINGGIPQLGNIDKHLQAFEETLNNNLPRGFNGIGVIDFENWRPIFRQNWNKQEVYKELSIKLGKKMYFDRGLNDQEILKAVENDFEKAATKFMVQTLEKAKELFPFASWGFYGFPHCYNQYSADIKQCAEGVTEENDRIQEIFHKSDVLFPSIYMNKSMIREDKNNLVIGRIKEAERVWKNRYTWHKTFVLPYMWIRYLNSKIYSDYLSATDIKDCLEVAKKNNARGIIIWARSEDVNSKEKCQNLQKFVTETLSPVIKEIGI